MPLLYFLIVGEGSSPTLAILRQLFSYSHSYYAANGKSNRREVCSEKLTRGEETMNNKKAENHATITSRPVNWGL